MKHHLSGLFIAGNLLVTAFFGCSIIVDGNIEPAPPDLDAGPDCTGVANGAACPGEDSSTLICLNGLCVEGRCGDGFVDTARGEECEPSPGSAGCNPADCTWRCSADADCDDGNLCNGVETCNLDTHTCIVSNRPAPGTDCALEGDESARGVCYGGGCIELQTCVNDAACDDGEPCNGAEICYPANPAASPRFCVAPAAAAIPAQGESCTVGADEGTCLEQICVPPAS